MNYTEIKRLFNEWRSIHNKARSEQVREIAYLNIIALAEVVGHLEMEWIEKTDAIKEQMRENQDEALVYDLREARND